MGRIVLTSLVWPAAAAVAFLPARARPACAAASAAASSITTAALMCRRQKRTEERVRALEQGWARAQQALEPGPKLRLVRAQAPRRGAPAGRDARGRFAPRR